ncbi:PQQ-dependent sugar dehydrogenase [Chitinophaga sp. NPDC101104]|uniref:PQQ-dependent sugar dehydrogenase n=1 Tax=Chitinophaga sp. NPDC101104 TaxID=3390561 RepID=UPI003CFE4764
MKNRAFYFATAVITLACSCYQTRQSKGGGQQADSVRETDPADIVLPEGYRAEVVAKGLNFPTALTFDDKGVPYVIEAGYSYGEDFSTPRLLRFSGGSPETVAEGEQNGPWTGVQYHNGNFYVAEGGQTHGGRILKISPGGKSTVLIERLPGQADHHTNGPAIKGNYLYFGTGSATNSGVVGPDNAEFGWLKRHPGLHDIPCEDIVLNGINFTSPNPLTPAEGDTAVTGAFLPFNTASHAGQTIPGRLPCSGAILRIPLEGGKPELVAWGLRNPYGLAFSPQGKLYVTENQADDRGSRPLWGVGDVLWEINPGDWFGWPDFAEGKPIAYFKPPGKSTPEKLLQDRKKPIPKPVAVLAVHSSSNGMDFSGSGRFGFEGEAFIAQFGDMAANVGKVLKPVGFKVVRVNTQTGEINDFAVNRGKRNGPGSKLGHGGLERPVSVRFSPSGESLYIVDFGVLLMKNGETRPVRNSGVIWKISKTD